MAAAAGVGTRRPRRRACKRWRSSERTHENGLILGASCLRFPAPLDRNVHASDARPRRLNLPRQARVESNTSAERSGPVADKTKMPTIPSSCGLRLALWSPGGTEVGYASRASRGKWEPSHAQPGTPRPMVFQRVELGEPRPWTLGTDGGARAPGWSLASPDFGRPTPPGMPLSPRSAGVRRTCRAVGNLQPPSRPRSRLIRRPPRQLFLQHRCWRWNCSHSETVHCRCPWLGWAAA